jgi:tetratricopeptide (TPR) repeat protein
VTPSPDTASESVVESLARLDTLVAARNWSEAVPVAERVAEAVEDTSGTRSRAYSDALVRLADLERLAGDHAAAGASYTRALSILESLGGSFNSHLIEPLRGLGLNYAAMGEHERAAAVLERAVLLTRRNRGLFDPSQLDLLEALAESQTETGETTAAEQTLRYRIQTAQQSYGADDARVAAPIARLARFYSRAAHYDFARSEYLKAIDLVEKTASENDGALIEPLLGLAENSMRAFIFGEIAGGTEPLTTSSMVSYDRRGDDPRPGNRRQLSTESEEALERALAILRTHPLGVAPTVLLPALLAAGDWYLAKGEPETAHERYREAWELSRSDPPEVEGTKATDASELALGYPVPVYVPAWSREVMHKAVPDEEAEEHYVLVKFAVGPDGQVADVKVVDSDASSRQLRTTVSTLEDSIYRPRYIDGEPVRTSGVRYRDVYRERRRDSDG